ncbi:MAG: hypothetical protein QOF53_2543 [Nocardioidaceae bacterium]|nr:hypothetical protein [Nocardioidaceae bacterium]
MPGRVKTASLIAIVKLDAKVSVSLSASGSRTSRDSLTEDFDVAPASRPRKILFYQGKQ